MNVAEVRKDRPSTMTGLTTTLPALALTCPSGECPEYAVIAIFRDEDGVVTGWVNQLTDICPYCGASFKDSLGGTPVTTQPTDWDSAINRINRLLDETESLKADLEQALSLLEKHEWQDVFIDNELYGQSCVECEAITWGSHPGHLPSCLWATLLSKYNREVRFHD